jgi:diadenosine tetraphosphate (Ap4A) HIT family hydrolase
VTRIHAALDPLLVWEDALFRVTQAEFCAWPGYLILRLKGPERALARLAPEEAAALGRALARCAAALERVTRAERVYLLSFAEVDRQLHVHLLPRTLALREAWSDGAGAPAGSPVDGPALFQWVRAVYHRPEDLPAGAPSPESVLEGLRAELAT